MPELSESVGKGGANASHDVRLVQLMLRTIAGKKGPYFPLPYTGLNSPRLEQAITDFQTDQTAGGADAGAGAEKGLVTPGSSTLRALGAKLSETLKNVRTSSAIPGLVYLERSREDLATSVAQIRGVENELEIRFADQLIKLVKEFYEKTGIVLVVQPRTGRLRSLDDQVNLASEGGPGESIHHYGLAVDLGFRDWRWVQADGTVAKPDDGYLDKTGLPLETRNALWKARNDIAIGKLRLYLTEMGGDKAHLQALEDAPLDSAGSWASLLQSRGPRKMKWEPYEMTPTSYKCDLGLGGALYLVGTALDIWVINPQDRRWQKYLAEKNLRPKLRLKKANLAKALDAKLAADRAFTLDRFFGKKSVHPGRPLTAADITDADMAAVHRILHDEFEGAAKHWREWTPIKYAGQKRPKHDKKKEQAPDPD